jgi:radical SAM superfamily enzyme YgiQ (UPF0313 family)
MRDDVDKILYPVGLGYIASAIHRSKHSVEIIDMDANRLNYNELEKELSQREFDAVGYGCIVTGYKIVKTLSEIVRRVNPQAWIIVGNSVASSIPDILLEKTDTDIAVIGEGDISIIELLDCIEKKGNPSSVEGICYKKNGEIRCNPKGRIIGKVDLIPLPEWELFDVERYLSMSYKYISEPFNCTFCYHVFKNDRYRFRTPENIIREIRLLQENYNVNYVNFWDELTFMTLRQTQELVDAILDSGLKFYWTGSCRGNLFKLKDLELLKRMKSAGCIGLGYSLESANRDILKSMNKKMDPKDFGVQVKALREAGIVTWTSLVIGYPEETEESIRETFDLCYELDVYPSAGFLLPQPGTPVYDYAKTHGFIKNEETYFLDMGDRQDLRMNLTKIPQDQLEEIVNYHLKRIRDKLHLDLNDEQLIKSGKYRAKRS